jgi:hypothetical protein
MSQAGEIQALIERLGDAAERLRASELPLVEASELIAQCAQLAAELTSRLEQLARGVAPAPAASQTAAQGRLTGPTQEPLL